MLLRLTKNNEAFHKLYARAKNKNWRSFKWHKTQKVLIFKIYDPRSAGSLRNYKLKVSEIRNETREVRTMNSRRHKQVKQPILTHQLISTTSPVTHTSLQCHGDFA